MTKWRWTPPRHSSVCWRGSAAQYLPCLSRPGSRSGLSPPAAAGGASWRPACSPPAPSLWQILWRGRRIQKNTHTHTHTMHNTENLKHLQGQRHRGPLTPTGLPTPGSARRTSRWWWAGWSTSSSTSFPRRRWSESTGKNNSHCGVVKGYFDLHIRLD